MTNSTAAPFSWRPSGFWDGNDGSWSTFPLRIGSSEQAIRVLPSTAGQATWTVIPQGCPPSFPANCNDTRGGLFDIEHSKSWKEIGNYSMGLELNLVLTQNATYGNDTVALGFNNTVGTEPLQSQVVMGYETRAFWTGVFGLGDQGTNFTSLANNHPSFLSTMKSEGRIPSLSWAYTAGAPYRTNGVFGSLTLGGYDSSRFIPNNVNFTLAQDITRDLVVGLQSISSSTSANGSALNLLPSPILTFIDSTLPYIYLPQEACEAFEDAFGLTWNATAEMYWINETVHQSLTATNPNFTFTIGDAQQGGPTVDIVLPYASFDLTATAPLAPTTPTRYFPLRRAADDSQYTLGRTFLQEAYLINNYEEQQFFVSQTRFDHDAVENIVAIPAIPSAVNDYSTPGNSRFNTRKIVGVTCGAASFLALCIIALLLVFRRRQDKKRRQQNNDARDDSNPFQDPRKSNDIGMLEIDNNSLCGKQEIPDTGKFELLDAASPSGSGNNIPEMARSTPDVAYELMAGRISSTTLGVVSNQDSPVGLGSDVSDLSLPPASHSPESKSNLNPNRKAPIIPSNEEIRDSNRQSSRFSKDETKYLPPSPALLVQPSTFHQTSKKVLSTPSQDGAGRFATSLPSPSWKNNSFTPSNKTSRAAPKSPSTPGSRSMDFDRPLPPLPTTPISESPQVGSPVQASFNNRSRTPTSQHTAMKPSRISATFQTLKTSPITIDTSHRSMTRRKSQSAPRRIPTGSSSSTARTAPSPLTPGGRPLTPTTEIDDCPSPITPTERQKYEERFNPFLSSPSSRSEVVVPKGQSWN